MSTQEELVHLSRDIRTLIIRMIARANTPHVGSALSCADLLAVLYHDVLRVDPQNPDDPNRDRFIMSKGHAAAALYATLAIHGFCDPEEVIENYCRVGLSGHVSRSALPGIEFGTGSLGHGLSVGIGMALVGKKDFRDYRVFVLSSDGECDEGSVWEAVLFAGHHGLSNLTLIVDYNKIQSFGRIEDVLNLEPFADKFRAFNWAVHEIDGHNHIAIRDALMTRIPGKPIAVIAHSVKGKGVSFYEDRLESHYKNPSPEEAKRALEEINRR